MEEKFVIKLAPSAATLLAVNQAKEYAIKFGDNLSDKEALRYALLALFQLECMKEDASDPVTIIRMVKAVILCEKTDGKIE